MLKRVFCLMGPTASGKTARACELVSRFPMEIVSIDSTMIYREMNIGSAKPDAATLARAPHHLIDILNPPEVYSAAQCCEDVAIICQAIFDRGHIPLLVGGTMMYFNALQNGLAPLPPADEQIRAALLQQASSKGWDYMHGLLAEVDAVSAARIHPHDTQRIQRALEVYTLTKKPLSTLWQEANSQAAFRFINLVLMPADRAVLHVHIAERFKHMLAHGLIAEVEELINKWSLTDANPSMKSVGYRQVAAYLQGAYDDDTLCEKGIAATRQLAKRQLTWLRQWPDKIELIAENPSIDSEMMAIVQQILDNPIKNE